MKREFLSVKVEGTSGKEGLGIDELCALPIEEGMTWMEGVEIPGDREEAVGPVVEEVCRRLRFL